MNQPAESLPPLAERKKAVAFVALCLCGLIAASVLAGCSVAIKAELLNPLNKSGRVERSEPVPTPAPTPSPSPTPKESR